MSSMRAETGYIKFEDDWRGVFIRGDEAGYLAVLLRTKIMAGELKIGAFEGRLNDLVRLLEGSHEGVNPIALVQEMLPYDQCRKSE
jgi:hypothetical protein